MAQYFTDGLMVLLLMGVLASRVSAQIATPPPDLSRATLEELMQVQIISVSRKEERADDAAAAVFVLTKDDIRRSGARTLPELFRLVPGVQVAQINSRNWAVAIRGFNDQFSNKLLVLIDGRSIYKRNFSGIFWDAEDVVIENIERIEVVRGPGRRRLGRERGQRRHQHRDPDGGEHRRRLCRRHRRNRGSPASHGAVRGHDRRRGLPRLHPVERSR